MPIRKKNNRIKKTKHRKNEMLKKFIFKKLNHLKKHRKIKGGIGKSKLIKAPKIFSIFENPNELLEIFQEIRDHCKKNRKKLILDMSDIEKLDVGSLIYLKYVVYDIKERKKKNITLNFKSPKNKELKKKIYNSGFVTYSKKRFYMQKAKENSKNYLTIEDNDNFKIQRGFKLDPELIRKILLFIDSKKDGAKKILYPIIHEMMENTILHAYGETEKPEYKDWYFFSEHNPKEIKFIFLDTGQGIVETAKKKWFDIFKIFNKESDILKEVLLGKHRTQTNKSFRGKGLPHIYEEAENNNILNLKIISNKACFNLNNNNDLKKDLVGTLFYWEIDLEGETNEHKL